MPTDMNVWRRRVREEVAWIADDEGQRRAWFGLGPEVDDPGETFNGFFDDAAVEQFVTEPNTGLSEKQLDCLSDLVMSMRTLSNETPQFLPPSFIDDPRWKVIQLKAKRCNEILTASSNI